MSRFAFDKAVHVNTERLAAFLVDGIQLTPVEREHVRECKLCLHLMHATACEELRHRRSNVAQFLRISRQTIGRAAQDAPGNSLNWSGS